MQISYRKIADKRAQETTPAHELQFIFSATGNFITVQYRLGGVGSESAGRA